MKAKFFKQFTTALFFILSLGLMGCSEGKVDTPEENKESIVDLATVLKHRDSYVGDNSAILAIVNHLPGNSYNQGIELQTMVEPYEITVHYQRFDQLTLRLAEDSRITSSFPHVLKMNAVILLALVPNASIIHFQIDDGTLITYHRKELEAEHQEVFGQELNTIITNYETVEAFIRATKE